MPPRNKQTQQRQTAHTLGITTPSAPPQPPSLDEIINQLAHHIAREVISKVTSLVESKVNGMVAAQVAQITSAAAKKHQAGPGAQVALTNQESGPIAGTRGKTYVGGPELQKVLGISPATLNRWEKSGIVPPAIRNPGMLPRWVLEEVMEKVKNRGDGTYSDAVV